MLIQNVHVNSNFDVDVKMKMVWGIGIVVHFDSIVNESVEASLLM